VDAHLLAAAEAGVHGYLDDARSSGRLADDYYQEARGRRAGRKGVFQRVCEWLEDPEIDRLSPQLKGGIQDAVEGRRWADLVNAFVREVKFGTGGIRALMAFDQASIKKLASDGIDARILKGPNTINNIVVMQSSFGVARYFVKKVGAGRATPPKAVIGYDSRIQGKAFARLIAETFLSEGLEVYLFDEAVPYPEVTFAIPRYQCDFGVFISASHNDYRYNGFKMSGANGAQIHYTARDEIIELIRRAAERRDEIQPVSLERAPAEILARLHWMGGKEPLPGASYFGRESSLLDVHSELVAQIKTFLMRPELLREDGPAGSLKIVYSAFNGSGRRLVPRMLGELGFRRLHQIASLDVLDGLFPCFKSAPGEEQQPDPGDPRAAVIALAELEKDQGKKDAAGRPPISWKEADLLIGTDPDADRCGVVLKPPPAFAKLLGSRQGLRYAPDRVLIPADDAWSLILWYRLQNDLEKHGAVRDASKKFIAISHTTSDMMTRIMQKHGIGVLKTWVGFGWLSTGVAAAWSGQTIPTFHEGKDTSRAYGPEDPCDRVFHDTTMMKPGMTWNVGALEQSNGFSILGQPPLHGDRELGVGGHVRDKDGTFASILVAEIAAYARHLGTDLLSMLATRLYADPDVGLFANYYEPDPLDGEYPGLEGDTKKKSILDRAIALQREAESGALTIGGRRVTGVSVYWTKKYDAENFPHFPDEGIRFFLGSELDHLTIRPSGTTNSMRFHVQFFGGPVAESEAWSRRLALEDEARGVVDEVRERLGAERQAGVEF
jgi:phosphomannomutase